MVWDDIFKMLKGKKTLPAKPVNLERVAFKNGEETKVSDK